MADNLYARVFSADGPVRLGVQTLWWKAHRPFLDDIPASRLCTDRGYDDERIQRKGAGEILAGFLMVQSMAWKGNCRNNLIMENFFGRLKVEIFTARRNPIRTTAVGRKPSRTISLSTTLTS